MQFFLRLPQLANPALLATFVSWYVREVPVTIVRMYRDYARAFAEMFSFTFMLRTLFAPWKGIADDYVLQGLNWELIAQAFFLNLTTRAIGFIFRIVAICFGVILQALCLAGFLAALLLWIAYPVLVIAAIAYLFSAF